MYPEGDLERAGVLSAITAADAAGVRMSFIQTADEVKELMQSPGNSRIHALVFDTFNIDECIGIRHS